MKDVMITIKSVQYDGDEKLETEVITAGSFEKIAGGYKLSYDETDATGFEGCSTVLKVLDGSKIEMTRSGATASELYIERGKKNFCLYGTPFGELTVGVQAKDVKSRLTDMGGSVFASYVIDINSSHMGDYDLDIEVRCK